MVLKRDRCRFLLGAVAVFLALIAGGRAVSQAENPAPAGAAPTVPITQGQRVFTCGHSFHYWIPPILANMAQMAGIQGHEAVGLSAIGGSRVIQHWDVPEDKNQAKKALRGGKVDVLTLSPMHQPDDGIEKFAALALEHNPHVRVTIQEFWIPWDKFEWPFAGKPDAVDFDAATIAELRKMHAPYFQTFDDHVRALNKKLGKQVVFVVPTGQAVLALREKIVAGQAPGLAKQSDLFSDKLGHPQPPLQALAAYCQFAVIYRTNPIGLPLPDILANAHKPAWDGKLNRLLQELAWDAVTHHPLSGVKSDANAMQATGVPSAPANFLLTHQGANDAVLTWTAAVAGPSPVSYYKVYRNGVAYDKTNSTTYTDSKAINITTPGYGPQPYLPATIYNYAVAAVDTQGQEGPRQEQCIAWVYHGGVDSWTLSTNSYNGGVNCNTQDTAGSPQNGAPCDIAVTVTDRANWWQPFSGPPFLHNMTPTTWAMELGALKYMTIDLKPTVTGQTWKLNVISRVSPGDNFNSAQVILGGADRKFGPQAEAGKWATYKVPFLNASGFANGSALQIGIGKYCGSIAGTSLTVTQMVSGMNVQGSSYLRGAGITPGTASSTGTYVASSNATNGQAGTYTIAPSQSAAKTLITAQRTNMYKFSLADLTGLSRNTYYVDNIGFTTQ